MPRSAKGNRTDLVAGAPQGTPPGMGQPNGQPVQPVTTPTGLPYGEAGQLQAAQQAQPLPNNAAPSQASAVSAAQNFQMPNLPDLHGPSVRPGEPVQSGLPQGPGVTPPPQGQGIGAMLTRMSAAVNSPALAQLAAQAGSLQQ